MYFSARLKFISLYRTAISAAQILVLPALTPYLQIGPVTCIIATTEYSVQERPRLSVVLDRIAQPA